MECRETESLSFYTGAGGKESVAYRFPNFFPEKVEALCEPFLGTGGSLLNNILFYKPKFVVTGDANHFLIHCVKTIVKNPVRCQEIYEMLKSKYGELSSEDSKVYFYEIRDLINSRTLDDCYLASCEMFLRSVAFPGRMIPTKESEISGCCWAKKCNKGTRNFIFLAKLLENATILSGDFMETLKEFVSKCPRSLMKNSLIYCDPPYATSESSRFYGSSKKGRAYHACFFPYGHHSAMWNSLRRYYLMGFKNIFVSGYNNRLTQRLYPGSEMVLAREDESLSAKLNKCRTVKKQVSESLYKMVPYDGDKSEFTSEAEDDFTPIDGLVTDFTIPF